ncbi:DUF262 domain-containing protein [Helicobacter sp. 11S02596-1]|uniref:DUF262 domain-containing protein n=1 Tax=Helicobacter sp. 11S02596-1 TaxID=1476194 RepID=UPI000BA4EF6C|nr:DUF262 domain-containing protein [Helicobacter sp. 11S02596-1]PAF44709.1 hypothetical protein BJI48_01580 [Helicobacter sp. 11S02596-1]
MKSNESNFRFIEQEGFIEIPFFQRAYVWKKEQWEQLFDDLLESFNNQKTHFLGSIILKQVSTDAGRGSVRSLIDGQQRLTTFSILVKSLFDKLDSDDRSDNAKTIYQTPTKEKNPKIKHSRLDRDDFSKILRAENCKTFLDRDEKLKKELKNKKLIQCYCYFSERINEVANFKEFFSYILDSKLWVLINLENNEDEQKIFDSINTSGLKLTATDIIKNAIFDKAIKLDSKWGEWLYEKYWEEIFEIDNQKRDFWDEELATGRLKRTRSEIFLHAFAIIYKFFDSEVSLEHLSSRYKEKIKDFNKDALESFLGDIKKYAIVYFNFPKIDQSTPLNFENFETRLFHILKITDTNTIIPLILKLKTDLLDNKEELEKCFYILEVFIIHRWISNKPTKPYNKIFGALTQNDLGGNYYASLKDALKEELPKVNEIKDCLISKYSYLSNKQASLILFWIELYRRFKNKSKQDTIELSYIYSLEHLMPQNWKKHWVEVGVNDELAESLIYQIGNMTLLKGALNSTIKDVAWEVKLHGDKSAKNNIEKCADLLITRELLNKEKWDKYTIEERSENLINEFFEIWDID